MRVLFLNHAFPGPFRQLAARLGSMPGVTVLFLSERGRRDVRLPGVRRLTLPPARDKSRSGGVADDGGDGAEREARLALRRGAVAANALLRLRRDGFVPDIICASAAMGHSFYARDVFPEAFLAVYADWYYTQGVNYTFFTGGRPRPSVDFAPARARNLLQANLLLDCDLAVTSTQWQKSQYPRPLAEGMHVLHEGVDTTFFSPVPGTRFVVEGCDLSGVRELVTFSGRGAEPFRGFPQFYRSLSRLFAARPECHALIMASGLESETSAALRAAMGGLPPPDERRVHILGFRPVVEYRQLLRASSAHVYLTAPFALSSGLFEALSCGCLLVGSDTEPVREVVRHGENGFLCDFWNTDALADTVADLLERGPELEGVRSAARRTILDGYDLSDLAPRQVGLLLDSYDARRPGR